GQCALILGAVELMYMKTPDYAVINSYVNIVKAKTDKYVAGFVNAVLRKIAKQKDVFTSSDSGVFFSQEFKSLLKSSYSSKEIEKIEKSSQNIPFLDISYKDEKTVGVLGGKKLPLGTIRLEAKGKISDLPEYEKGIWWVQDFSSALPVKMLDNIKGKDVLELCSAPGGKTAQLLSFGAIVTCLDVNENRLDILRENMDRLKLKPKEIICADALEFLDTNDKKYDLVVLDAPCSATGTLRRHPEIVHIKTKKDVEAQAKLQKAFLSKVDRALKAGGELLYCTCSLCKEEGEMQIREFLEENKNYKVVNLKNKTPKELDKLITKEGFLRVLPYFMDDFGGADGFFVARLRKEK
ncbi:MAG: RsmB/NOP family class I SAM-dependent RNA methyltransferase, partial [Alphaproteobacteria bacterium]|nr:RsmB/NOP family class I SAM-dependent RNA methyltransferase [Alphaproteobacteria bacterium]